MNPTKSPISADVVKTVIEKIGIDVSGIAKTEPVSGSQDYLSWLDNGYAAEMNYLGRNIEKRFNPEKLFKEAKAIIVVGLNYYPTERDINHRGSPYNVARYAWGRDYHDILRQKLENIRNELEKIYPGIRGLICVDTAPFLDKQWAQKAGLGWQGKHTNLVSRQFGSWLFIGSLIINREVDKYDKPETNHCGRCTACLDICPTGALMAPHRIDAARCISYWTIESKAEKIPDNIAKDLNGYVFGCDICLEVCPFNKFQKAHHTKELSRRKEINLLENGDVINLTEEQFKKAFSDSPISRPKLAGIKRNIEAAAKNKS